MENIIELKIKLTEQDTNIEDSVKEKELKALKFSLKKISDSTLLIFEGELKKIGFSRDEINSMDMQSVDTQIEGFIVNSINKKGLNKVDSFGVIEVPVPPITYIYADKIEVQE